MNATTEVNAQVLKLTKDLHQQVDTMANTNNRTNPLNPPNSRNPSNASNNRNHHRHNTRKYCWLHGSFSHTSKDWNTKKTGQKDSEMFCDKMEGSENYCRTTAEWRGWMKIEKDKNSGWINLPFNLKNIQWIISKLVQYHYHPLQSYLKIFYDYLLLRDIAALEDVVAEKFGPTVVLPDTSTLTANETGKLPLSSTISSLAEKYGVWQPTTQLVSYFRPDPIFGRRPKLQTC